MPTTTYSGSFKKAYQFNEIAHDRAMASRPPATHSYGKRHADTTRIQALAVYAETGNASQSAKAMGLPRQTVEGWIQEEGTPQLIDELRSTIRFNEGWRIASMVGQSLDLVAQAMREGDPVILRDGRTVYKRASLKDLVVTSSILIDKWMLISGAMSQSNALLQGVSALSAQLGEMGSALTGLAASVSAPSKEPSAPDKPGLAPTWDPYSEAPPRENLIG